MKINKLVLSIGMTAVIAMQAVQAVPFSSFDPRSFAMGGAGVAAGTSANAVFFNPALLAAAKKNEDFSLELPIVGVRAADPDDMLDAVDTLDANNSMQGLTDAISNYSTVGHPDQGLSGPVVAAANQLKADLQGVSQKAVQLEGNAAVVMGIPGKTLGVSVFANVWGVGGTVADVTAADLTAIDTVITDVLTAPPPTDPTGSFTSSISARFAAIKEVGVALASDFNGIAVGITPKAVEVTTNDYRFVGNQIDNATIDQDQGENTESNFNLDIGVAKDFKNGFKAGLAVKNVLAQEYTTVLNNKISIEPMARVGLAHDTSWTTVALDVDLTENDPGGFDSKTQFVALGVELDLLNTLQLRFGVRHNMSDTPFETEVYSAGVGFSPFGIHVDVSAAGNNDEVGAAMQLGFRF